MQASEVVVDAPRARSIRIWTIVTIVGAIVGGLAMIVAVILVVTIPFVGLAMLPVGLILGGLGFLVFLVAIVAAFVRIDLHASDRKAIEFAIASAGHGQIDAGRLLRGDAVVTSSGHWARLRRISDGEKSWMIVTLTPAGPRLR